MLSARRVSLRIAFQPWTAEVTCATRFFSERNRALPNDADVPTKAAAKPSLIEQLFPEEVKRYEEQQPKASREVPRLPLGNGQPCGPPQRVLRPTDAQPDSDVTNPWTRKERKTEGRLRAEMAAEPPGTGVLVLRNATKNLTEEDFRRVIPQGRHIEGWTLQEGDILKVIPGRKLDTLEQQSFYYILFNSQLGAHMYKWHVTRIHKLAAIHTPTSNTSPIPPPPGYMVEGIDAHAAIQAYTLVPPSQKLELRQLRRPFTPSVQSVVKFQGIKGLVQRQGKMPFEARLTMEGPQLYANTIRHIMLETGKRRNLGWSGSEKFNMQVTNWEPRSTSRAMTADSAENNASGLRDGQESDLSGQQMRKAATRATNSALQQKQMRTPKHVFIVGFHTENAARSFIAHWHKRPLELPGPKAMVVEEDSPPIAHVEMLW